MISWIVQIYNLNQYHNSNLYLLRSVARVFYNIRLIFVIQKFIKYYKGEFYCYVNYLSRNLTLKAM